MQPRNQPFEYPYGEKLEALFNEIFEGTIYALQNNHFTPGVELDPVAKRNDFFSCGKYVYRDADRLKFQAATEMISMATCLSEQPGIAPATENLANKIEYYSRFKDKVNDTITDEQRSEGVAAYYAMSRYGLYRKEQLTRYDIRVFSSDTSKNFLE